MTKHEMIEAIRQHESGPRGASVAFLMAFEEAELDQYLRRLSLVGQRGSSWARQGNDNAVTVRDCLSRRAVAA